MYFLSCSIEKSLKSSFVEYSYELMQKSLLPIDILAKL